MNRRGAIAGALGLALTGRAAGAVTPDGAYGLVGRITAKPGQRAALGQLLLGGSADMPGCLAYLVAEDANNANLLWVTEAWESKAAHEASLQLPAVRDAIRQAVPIVAAFETVATTRPLRSRRP
ncbi:Quinol monooxygenase YgiN [Sphingomonas guangdongensis]|uniref:Quinol monooxygenase YgiN n=1 Tax=Sphingomonas guangdongensis TaxID=1141890 RepID=A0A285QBN8_9SPHN|nr:putative quinol monooxygenase [Sphingomonas guangdongensis]SOB79365.1 Quinol monooxygenase YgiN [Sphingomonas guangdongensis]